MHEDNFERPNWPMMFVMKILTEYDVALANKNIVTTCKRREINMQWMPPKYE